MARTFTTVIVAFDDGTQEVLTFPYVLTWTQQQHCFIGLMRIREESSPLGAVVVTRRNIAQFAAHEVVVMADQGRSSPVALDIVAALRAKEE